MGIIKNETEGVPQVFFFYHTFTVGFYIKKYVEQDWRLNWAKFYESVLRKFVAKK